MAWMVVKNVAAKIDSSTPDSSLRNWWVTHVGIEQYDFAIDGRSVWKLEWHRSVLETVRLPSPHYPSELKVFTIYEVVDSDWSAGFAGTEVSNGIYVFYRELEP